ILEVIEAVCTKDTNGLCQVQFLRHVCEQAVEATDDDNWCQLPRLNSQHLELRRKQVWITNCFIDVGIDAVDERIDDCFAMRVIPVKFLFQIASKQKQPRPCIPFECFSSQ